MIPHILLFSIMEYSSDEKQEKRLSEELASWTVAGLTGPSLKTTAQNP